MCEYGACRGAGQLLGPSNPWVELVLWSPNGGEDGFPDAHTPGWIWLWSPNGDYDTFSVQPLPDCQERTSGSHCPLPLVRLGQHLEGHRQWALTKQKVCGTVPGGGGQPRGHETVPGEGGAYWSLCVPKGRARSGLPQEPL